MSNNNLHIRDLDPNDILWIKQNTPSGISQNQFLKNIISSAREEEFGYSLFSKPTIPSYLYGKLPFKFIDLFAAYTDGASVDTLMYYFIPGDFHWNEKGHALTAKAFLNQFKE